MKRSFAANTRNVCILAHVDHGKTTYADSLLAANGILSSRMAGKIRYLDSRIDEQERGITMQSSAVSLSYRTISQGQTRDYVINLIDTPGHVDFSSEVSTASRLCDGALVLVDAIEGVCTQTITVLRQAWAERLRPILVINKMDRLITELKLAPIEAYHHLVQLVEQVNAVMGSFFAAERMEDHERWQVERDQRLQAKKTQAQEELVSEANASTGEATEQVETDVYNDQVDDEDIYFAPELGNVIFASAVDGWAFRLDQFAHLHSVRLNIQQDKLCRVLWGDFFLDPKLKRVVSRKFVTQTKKSLKPMFVQFVLENIWAIYDCVLLNHNMDKITKIISTLNLKIKPQDLKNKDGSTLLFAIFSQWLPLASATFRAVVDKIPAPVDSQQVRLPRMLHPELAHSIKVVKPTSDLESDLYHAKADDATCTVSYVSKMFAVPTADLPQNQRRQLTAEEMRSRGRQAREAAAAAAALASATGSTLSEDTAVPFTATTAAPTTTTTTTEPAENLDGETIIGFARCYSGTLSVGQKLFCLFPKYDMSLSPLHPTNKSQIQVVTVSHLYMLMGRELVSVDKVPAGNVFGIGGLEDVVQRSATLCAPMSASEVTLENAEHFRDALVNLGKLAFTSAPILRIALEPVETSEMSKLVEGLKKLNQADPAVETLVQETGEHVILTAGELHAERCIRDLTERFAKIRIQASKPIVPFRETAIQVADMNPPKNPNLPRGTAEIKLGEDALHVVIRARPLPPALKTFLVEQAASLRHLVSLVQNDVDLAATTDVQSSVVLTEAQVLEKIEALLKAAGSDWAPALPLLRAFGPRSIGPNMLFDKTQGPLNSLQSRVLQHLDVTANGKDTDASLKPIYDGIDTAFQLATLKGPLCAEPMEGLAFFIESITFDSQVDNARLSQIAGSLISAGQEACRTGFLDWSPRLLLAMYSCDIQASADVLGKVYAVLSQRHGRIVSEEMKESTTFFTIRALLPVIDSFGFAEDIRKRTSGAASPQLVFHGFEMLDQDPFWVPTTEEELEDLGEKADRENIARKYMDQVRRRKGLATATKVIEAAEKQRTLRR